MRFQWADETNNLSEYVNSYVFKLNIYLTLSQKLYNFWDNTYRCVVDQVSAIPRLFLPDCRATFRKNTRMFPESG